MLALDRPLGVVAGLVLFGDHADPDRVYYAPTRPKLAQLGDAAEMSFIKFRGDDPEANDAAGLLSFTTELTATDDQISEARQHLMEQGVPQPVFAMFPWRAGKAVFAAALQEGDGFVEQLLGEVTPDLMGGNRAMFSARLTPNGAALVEAMIEDGGTSPLGVRYELEYAGLRPALEVRIRADYSRIYDELSVGFQAGVAYQGVGVRIGVESATKKLVENGAIEVEVLHFSDDADLRSRVDEAVRWFQGRILDEMFQSALQNTNARANMLEMATQAAAALGAGLSEALADDTMAGQLAEQLGVSPAGLQNMLGGAGGAGGAGGQGGGESQFALNLEFSFKDIRQEELRVVTLDWREAHAETRTAAPQGLLGDLGSVPEVIEADGLDDFWRNMRVNVRPLGDFAALGVERLVVQLAYPDENAGDATRDAFPFEPGDADPRSFSAFTDGKPPQYRAQSETHFAAEGIWPGEPKFTGEWKTYNTLELALHPLMDVPRLELEVSPGSVDFEATPQVQVDVRVDGEVAATQMLSAESGPLVIRQRLGPAPEASAEVDAEAETDEAAEPTPRFAVRYTWFFEGGGSTEGEWTPIEGTALLVPAPWRSFRQVRVVPLLPPGFIDASVTVSIDDGGRTRSETVQLVPGERRPQAISLPSVAESAPPARVETLVVRGDGSTFLGEAYETTDPVILVRDRNDDPRRVMVRLVAEERLATHGLLALQLQLLGEGDTVVDSLAFTESTRDPQPLLVPADEDGNLRYRYRVVRYGLDGTANAAEPVETTEPELMIPAVGPTPDDG